MRCTAGASLRPAPCKVQPFTSAARSSSGRRRGRQSVAVRAAAVRAQRSLQQPARVGRPLSTLGSRPRHAIGARRWTCLSCRRCRRRRLPPPPRSNASCNSACLPACPSQDQYVLAKLEDTEKSFKELQVGGWQWMGLCCSPDSLFSVAVRCCRECQPRSVSLL